MSSKPKFEVGEVVVVASEQWPEFNGDATVIKSAYLETRNLVDGEIGYGWKYKVDTQPDMTLWYRESSLKKKHLPGNLSFRDLMQTLKDPSKCQNA